MTVTLCDSVTEAYGGVLLHCARWSGHGGVCQTTKAGYENVRWIKPSPQVKPRARSAAAKAVLG